MEKILTILTKELRDYFRSPMAYIVLCITFLVFNIFFYMIIDQNREATMRDMFKLMEFMFVFIIPLLTMKLLAAERQEGTMEFLMTCPLSTRDIVAGKYLGSFCFIAILISLTLVYCSIIELFSRLDWQATILGYAGILLEAALFIAIGLMTSSWTGNQLIAAISSYAIIFLLYFSVSFIKYLHGPLETFIRHLSFWGHTENLSGGLLQWSDVVYFASAIFFCLFMTRLSLDKRT